MAFGRQEFVDNALDGAEEAGIAPIIGISVSGDGITVADNGQGIATETVGRGARGATRSRLPFALDDKRSRGHAFQRQRKMTAGTAADYEPRSGFPAASRDYFADKMAIDELFGR